MPPSYTSEQLHTFAAEILANFDDEFVAARLGAKPSALWDWIGEVGMVIPLDAPVQKFPIGLLGGGFVETRAGNKAAGMSGRQIDLEVVEYDDGIEESLLMLLLSSAARTVWDAAPGRMADRAKVLRAKLFATVLQAGTSTALSEDGVLLFSTAHPLFNTSATFSNYETNATAVSISAIVAQSALMSAAVKDDDGDPLVINVDRLYVPLGKYQTIKSELAKEYLSGGESNPLYGNGMKVIPIPQLDALDANDWYLGSSEVLRDRPAVVGGFLDPGSALSLRDLDTSSDFFKTTGKIRKNVHIWEGARAGFAHGIRRITGA